MWQRDAPAPPEPDPELGIVFWGSVRQISLPFGGLLRVRAGLTGVYGCMRDFLVS